MSLPLLVSTAAAVLTLALVTVLGGRVERRRGRGAALVAVILLTPILFGTLVAVVWVAAMGAIIVGGSFAP